ncbi:hypothetical protein JCM15548_11694 [Geofilum rubicundum JCM 15548]|uniref:Uncharacterized protein n=1 Tax=Geofilum rubicundum JCM 15548 TaxID=1236989 RepID=A0A0E9LW27_9BACT|nr:hypothetical protein JCM15548_11694 [Geofilum rubicundum JCM 15548]
MIRPWRHDGKSEFEALKKAYLAEDIFAMQALMDENELMSEYGYILLGKRNKAWLEVLPEIFQKQTSLVAVGARHLPGKDGLLNLLTEAGYTGEPVFLTVSFKFLCVTARKLGRVRRSSQPALRPVLAMPKQRMP